MSQININNIHILHMTPSSSFQFLTFLLLRFVIYMIDLISGNSILGDSSLVRRGIGRLSAGGEASNGGRYYRNGRVCVVMSGSPGFPFVPWPKARGYLVEPGISGCMVWNILGGKLKAIIVNAL
ncbi:hypothetical protein Pst134EB_002305 [Puccinia striiformis f. sp. tritici]|nr:hypothetical protein Pst134EB_002305 [Puccinia striiformis f. sp. tritici]